MDWSKGFSAKYILKTVNPDTWADKEEFDFSDGSIDYDSSADLRASASVTLPGKIDDGETWIRIYLQATQGGDGATVPIFTGLTTTPERQLDGAKETYKVDCYSTLKPCEDVILPRGYYVPAGSGAAKIKELLSVSPALVEVVGDSPGITDSIVAEDGETRLSMALQILDAINWQIQILGDGTIRIQPKDMDPVLTMSADENDIIETSVTDTNDWYDIPNCYMAISDDYGAAVARDDSGSPLSTVTRGREVWQCGSGVDLSGETIAEYAARKLKELQASARSLEYTRRFFTGVHVGDRVAISYPGYDLVGVFRISSQSLELSQGCKVKEKVASDE